MAAIYYLILFVALVPVGYAVAVVTERIRERRAA